VACHKPWRQCFPVHAAAPGDDGDELAQLVRHTAASPQALALEFLLQLRVRGGLSRCWPFADGDHEAWPEPSVVVDLETD